jgi:hypothetical protein
VKYQVGETYHIIQAMKATGNRPGIIQQWKDAVAEWAQINRIDADAAAVNAWLPHWQVRPFYTVEELAPMWPALAIATGFTQRWPSVLKSPKRLEHELDFHGLPRVMIDGQKYYVVDRLHFWKNASEEELKNVISAR